MEKAQPSYDELTRINTAQQQQIDLQAQQIALLKYELAQLKKSIVGPRSDRFIPTQDGQSTLFDQETISAEVAHPTTQEDLKVVGNKRTGKLPKRLKMKTIFLRKNNTRT